MKEVLKLFSKPDDMTNDEFLLYLYNNKSQLNLSWKDIANVMNQYAEKQYSEDKYRKQCSRLNPSVPDMASTFEGKQQMFVVDENNNINIEEEFSTRKELQRIKDERNQLNSIYRQMSREDTLKDIAIECAKEVAKEKPHIPYAITSKESDKEAILLLSDWHYGIEISNYWNTYNPEICKERLSKLLTQTIGFIEKYEISKIHALNLGDLISGRIHSQIRIENREDVISQVMHVSELLYSFLNELSNYAEVTYRDCLDNHSRIEPDRKLSLRLESLARITSWYLEERFKLDPNVRIYFNEYSDDIITFTCKRWTIAGVHGDLDSQKNVVKNLRGMLYDRPDLICTAHMHHFSADEENKCVVISNPSLMGTDSFAESKRLSSNPSQVLIIVSSESPVYAIHKIDLV